MQVYSDTIHSFLAKMRANMRSILSKELALSVRKSRFEFNGYLIPINLVVFEHETRLGQFDPHTYQIAINRKLMMFAKDVVINNVLRHEIAHLLTYLKFGPSVEAHGTEFKEVCRNTNWGKDVFSAYANLDLENKKFEGDIKSEKVVSKIKKLLALAQSSNEHEADMATRKANQLLLKHNLSTIDITEEDKEVCLKRTLSTKRNNAKFQAIYEILTTFFVQPVFSHGKGMVYLEIIGDRVSVELADYVANFLDKEMEALWKKEQVKNPTLKGSAKKNSFMRGLGNGYVEKIKSDQNQEYSEKSLIVLKKDLKEKVNTVYSKLSQSKTKSSSHCKETAKLGNQAGKSLSINPGLKSGGKKILSLIFNKDK